MGNLQWRNTPIYKCYERLQEVREKKANEERSGRPICKALSQVATIKGMLDNDNYLRNCGQDCLWLWDYVQNYS